MITQMVHKLQQKYDILWQRTLWGTDSPGIKSRSKKCTLVTICILGMFIISAAVWNDNNIHNRLITWYFYLVYLLGRFYSEKISKLIWFSLSTVKKKTWIRVSVQHQDTCSVLVWRLCSIEGNWYYVLVHVKRRWSWP